MADETVLLPARKTTTTIDGDVNVTGDVTVTGSVATAGLTTAGLITIVALNSSTWTALPPSPLAARNAITIQNESAINVKYNYTTPGGYVGVTIAAGNERFLNITDSIIIYAKSASGTPSVTVEEVS